MDNENTKNNQIDLKNSRGHKDGAGEREQRWDNKVIIIIAAMRWPCINVLGALYEPLHTNTAGQVS